MSSINFSKIFQSLQIETLQINKYKFKDKDEFQIITSDEISNSVDDTNHIDSRKHIKNEIIINSFSSDNKLTNNSIWSLVSEKISNFSNTLKYNIITTNSYIDFNTLKYIRIFNKIIDEKQILNKEIEREAFKFFQMSYRSHFEPIFNNGKLFTSDCGWGCMIRSAQMMLAKAILEIKLNEGVPLEIAREKTLLLFYDNSIKLNNVKDNKDFDYIHEIDSDHEYITPPFSIQNICQLGVFYGKGAGIWFSDYIMIKIFSEINYNL